MEFRADLHLHSTFSDGMFTPKELISKAHESQIQGISITDHDTISAYSSELFHYAKEMNVELLTGVEISSALRNETIHILGYGFDYNSHKLSDFLKEVRQKRNNRNRAILKKLAVYGIKISEDELYRETPDSSSVGRPHIAYLMVKKGYVSDFRAAFQEYLKDGAKCYVEGEKFTPGDVIKALHEVKGKAVLAHPHLIKDFTIIQALIEMDFDGIEAYYGKMTPDKEKRWVKIGEKKGWIITGGSDYHGEIKPFLTLGCSWVCKKTFDLLRS